MGQDAQGVQVAGLHGRGRLHPAAAASALAARSNLPPHGARARAGAAPGARLAAVRHELVLPQAGLGALGGREEAEHPEDDQRRQVQEHDGRDRQRLRAAPRARAPQACEQAPMYERASRPSRARSAASDAQMHLNRRPRRAGLSACKQWAAACKHEAASAGGPLRTQRGRTFVST